MTLYTFSGVTSGNFAAANLGEGDDVHVELGALVYATHAVGIGILANGSGHDIEVLGTIFGALSPLVLGSDASTSTGNNVTVRASGVLSSNSEGLFINGYGSTIDNAGHITGGFGILIQAIHGGTETTIDNSGSIIGTGSVAYYAGIVHSGSETLVVTNTGLIKGLTMAFNGASGGGGISEITNSGVMRGNVLFGAGNDLYDGRLGVIYGDVFGNEGLDILRGGAGDETLDGGEENDTLEGNAGTDTLIGDDGDDTLDGGAGADQMDGGADNDTYHVDNAGDVAVEKSGGGKDIVSAAISWTLANHIDNLILTGTGNLKGSGNGLGNALTGNNGSNDLAGLGGNDVMKGGIGADQLTGGAGADSLYGGLNADRFIFAALSDSTRTASGRDTIFDFSHAQGDRIDLSALDASARASGNQAFTLIGEAVFSGTAGQLRYVNSDGDTFVHGDTNGDKTADFAIKLEGTIDLVARDFLL